MAQPYSKAVMTQAGLALIARAVAGDCHIVFTRVAVGDGKPEDLENATKLESEKAEYPVYSISYHSDTCVRIRTLISNWDTENQKAIVTEGFYMNEIGVFAMGSDDGVEVLYSIAVTEGEQGDYMPAYDSTNPIMIQQDYYVTVDNALNVSVQVPNELYLLADDAVTVYYDAPSETLVFASGNYATGGGGGSEYVLPVATETRLGGIKIGSGLKIETDGTTSVDFSKIPDDAEVSSAIVESGTEEMTQTEVDEAYDQAKE